MDGKLFRARWMVRICSGTIIMVQCIPRHIAVLMNFVYTDKNYSSAPSRYDLGSGKLLKT